MSLPEPTEESLRRLSRTLRGAEAKRQIFVPPTRDEAILKQAREYLAGPQKRSPLPLWQRWFAFAGVTVLVALLVFVLPRETSKAVAREDINGDGAVDILDAMALAKAMESGAATPKLDQNGDGKLDENDVRAVAVAAVRIEGRPRS